MILPKFVQIFLFANSDVTKENIPCSTFLCGPMTVRLGGILLSISFATADERVF